MGNLEENSEKMPVWQSTKAVWRIIIVMTIIGVVSVIIMSIQFAGDKNKQPSFLDTIQVIGAALLVAGASFTSGGLGGFLFGIPKVLQNPNQPSDQTSLNKISIVQNDNLVEISDWLTKIIVGVGLTQLYQIPHFLGKIGTYFSSVFNGDDKSSKAAVVSIILYFLALGFFAVYLWTRLFFVRSLKELNDQLQKELENTTSQIVQARGELEDLNQQKNNIP